MEQELQVPGVPIEIAAKLWRIRNGGFASNTYICGLEESGRCLVIDPGLDVEAIETALKHLGVTPAGIFCTHGHFDHVGGAAHLQKEYDAPLHLHRADLKVLKTANFTMMICQVQGRVTIPAVNVLAEDGSEFLTGSNLVTFVHTPGHTPGSSFILFRDFAFSGDTMYRDSVGLSNLPGQDTDQLRESIIKVWDGLPDSCLICPGHGGAGEFASIKHQNHKLRSFIGLPRNSGTF